MSAPATIKFELGEPQVLALAYPTGKPVQSRYSGDQLMFTCTDGSRFYVEPYVQARIEAAGIGPNQPFEMCKVQTVEGNRRTVEYKVRAIEAAAVRPTVGRVAFAPAPPPAAPVNGTGQTDADLYVECFREAVAIALRGVELAKAAGLLISPAFEDVRAIATTISIGRRQ